MAAQITVATTEKGAGWECVVTVFEANSATTHVVMLDRSYLDRIAGPGVPVERLIQKSFEFLLAREPKESILRSFALPVISRYFPEYEDEIRKHLK